MSDIFFLVSTICVIVITVLLSYVLIRVINTLDEMRTIVLKTRDVTNNATKAFATVATLGGILSPAFGVMRRSKKRKRGYSDD